MEVLNQHISLIDTDAETLGLGVRLQMEIDGVLVVEKIVYGDTLHAIADYSHAKFLGDEDEIIETYKRLPKEFK